MSKGSPSMIALLGLLAMAGYANRDKLSGMLQAGASGNRPDDPRDDGYQGGAGSAGLMDNLKRLMSGEGTSGGLGGNLSGGLSELLARFTNPVQSAKAKTWVDTGPNSALAPEDLEHVLDEDDLAELSQKTGLSRAELLSRLSTTLPEAVDKMTPDGRLPTADEARALF